MNVELFDQNDGCLSVPFVPCFEGRTAIPGQYIKIKIEVTQTVEKSHGITIKWLSPSFIFVVKLDRSDPQTARYQ